MTTSAPNNPISFDGIPESKIVELLRHEFIAQCSLSPEFVVKMDDADTDVCDRSELFDLIRTAPTREIQMYLYGVFALRGNIALFTGRGNSW